MHGIWKQTAKSRGWMAWAVTAAVMAAGCEDPTDPVPGGSEVASVTVSPATAALVVGDTVTLRAVARSAAGDTLSRPVAWTSGNPQKASVTAAGRVTAQAAGSVTVLAAVDGRVGQAVLTIVDPPAAPVIWRLLPEETWAAGPGLTVTIAGIGFHPDARVEWNGAARPSERLSETDIRVALSPADVAEIGTAEVRVLNPGDGTVSDPALFRIVQNPDPVTELSLRPAVAITRLGASVSLLATPRGATGVPLHNRLVTWTSSDESRATVDAAGVVTPLGEGEVTITARSEGVDATSVIDVKRDALLHLVASDGVGLTSLDLRLGTPPTRFWEHGEGMRAYDPSPSPDRRMIAYVMESTSSGSARSYVTIHDRVARTYLPLAFDGRADQPAWSPTGDRIAFRGVVGDRSFVFTIRPDGTGLTNLTEDLPIESSALDPAWSPDGSRIVFAVQSDPGFHGLMTMNADGSGRKILTSGGVDTQPHWLGDVVVFTRRDPFGTATDVWRTSVSGLGPFMPLTTSGTAHSPALSPDHGWVAYVEGEADGPGAIMLMRPFGQNARPVSLPSDGPGSGGMTPAWVVQR